MKNIYLLLFLLLAQSIAAQNHSEETFLGCWKLTSVNGKKISAGIVMNLVVEPGKMSINNEFEVVNCSWVFSDNMQYIYCSNDKSDEDWQLLELSESRLLFVDKGQKMEFMKTAKYKKIAA